VRLFLIPLIAIFVLGCGNTNKPEQAVRKNMVGYFEIPVADLNRATSFYRAVFGYEFTRQSIDGNEMALFPEATGSARRISGALAKGQTYVPSLNGTLVYFETDDIHKVLKAANANGGKTLYPRTSIGELGFVAEIQDSEGNRIGLHEEKPRP
jgi:hypothetical protein